MSDVDNILTDAVCRAIRAPIAEARTLPRQAFTSAAYAEAEAERVFAGNWCALYFDELVAQPGDAVPVDLAGMPLLLARDGDGALRVFHNIVPYDGCPAVLEPRHNVQQIVTPYHGWRYSLQGKLQALPDWGGDPDGEDLAALNGRPGDLVEVPSGRWGPVVFVNVDGGAGPFSDAIAPLASELRPWDVDDVHISRGGDGNPLLFPESLATNWKTHAENWGINVLHEAFVHDIYDRSSEVPRMRADGVRTCSDHVDGRFLALKYREADFPETYGEIPFPRLEKDPTTPIEYGYFGTFLPNLHVGVFANMVHLIISNPKGPAHTENLRAQFYLRDAASDPALLDAREQYAAGFVMAGEEDGRITEAVQRARSSTAFHNQYYSELWDEMHYRLTQWLLDQMVQSND